MASPRGPNGNATLSKAAHKLKDVDHVVLVLSGKGGVGKSTCSVEIATALVKKGKKVGILDIDLCGPSIPRMLGLDNSSVHQCDEGWVPVYADDEKQLSVMSIGFLLGSSSDAVVWRGPKKTAMIQSFLEDVYWSKLDYLIVDTPPGTSDEHLAVVESLRGYKPDGAVLITTPQGVALSDVRREASFCKKAKLKILGIVENMSGFVCPHCAECSNLFSSGGGERLAEELTVPFLGRIPIDPDLGKTLDEGKDFLKHFSASQVAQSVEKIIQPLLDLPKINRA
eukprot:m.134337 g.134337  ORF g.134337 m.134337 type:complete len:282 (-) comp29734_c1_seq1:84-929(-)